MSLYHKYRPTSLGQVKGNKEIVSSLGNLLKSPSTMPHTYLFKGPTGCGKTTLARIIAKELEITDADFVEMNSSDFKGIDTIREIIRNVAYKPLESPYRIYLLDECHKLTNDAQNALLKTLEDTPKHVIFILCTTDPQKLLAAILGRCQEFTVRTLTAEEMVNLLTRVSRKEKEKVDKKILEQIAEDSQGHPRNALQILEKVLAVEPELREDVAKQTAEDLNKSIDLCKALIAGKPWKVVKNIVKDLKDQDPEGVRRHVLAYAQAVHLNKGDAQSGLVLEEFIEPFYHTGFPQLVLACSRVCNGGE